MSWPPHAGRPYPPGPVTSGAAPEGSGCCSPASPPSSSDRCSLEKKLPHCNQHSKINYRWNLQAFLVRCLKILHHRLHFFKLWEIRITLFLNKFLIQYKSCFKTFFYKLIFVNTVFLKLLSILSSFFCFPEQRSTKRNNHPLLSHTLYMSFFPWITMLSITLFCQRQECNHVTISSGQRLVNICRYFLQLMTYLFEYNVQL